MHFESFPNLLKKVSCEKMKIQSSEDPWSLIPVYIDDILISTPKSSVN